MNEPDIYDAVAEFRERNKIVPREQDVVYHGTFRLYNAESSNRSGYTVEFVLGEERDYETFKALTKRRKGKAGHLFEVFFKDSVGAWDRFEMQLLRWSVTNGVGAKVKFALSEATEFPYFREATAYVQDATNPIAWEAIVAEKADDGKLVDQVQRERVETLKGGPISRNAGQLCADAVFRAFVGERMGIERSATSDEAAQFVREKCGVTSRAELDHNEKAAGRYERWIKKPYLHFAEARR